MDWASFTFDYRLEFDEIYLPIIHIEAYKEAALNLYLPPDWREQLDKLNRVRAVHGTTALEGNPLSEAEVLKQIELSDQPSIGQGRETASREQLQIRNAGLAQNWVRERFHPGSSPITISDILEMHRMVTIESDTGNNIPGRFRTWEVHVGSEDMGGVHKGAPPADVPRLMEEYIEFVNSRRLTEQLHSVMRALLAHYYLVTIHPFGDGNGRVCRLIEAGILFQGGYNVHGFYGLSNYFYHNEREYKTTLQGCRAVQPFDVTPFVIFGLNGFVSELKGINNFIKTKLNRVVYRTKMGDAYNRRTGRRRRLLNQREWSLLHFLLTATEPIDPFSDAPSRQIKLSELRDLPYVQAAYRTVTPRTFHRELVRLKDTGFIEFKQDEISKDWIVELDFAVIGRY